MKKLFTALMILVASISASSQCTNLFISEYIEGSSNNKAIEIYNPTAAPANLADYSLHLFSNGSATVTASVTLTGMLMPYQTFVISHGSANATILALANQTSNAVINFNGDDAVELRHLGVPIDRFGIIGVDPGTSWTINGNVNGSVNKTLIRMANVQSGDLTWTGTGENQWIIYNQDVTNYLDLHVMNTCGSTLTGSGSGGSICLDVTSSFTVSGSGGAGGYNYIWDFGDGSTQSNGANVTHTFAAAGTYNISYVIYDAAFNIYSETFPLTVNVAPTACSFISTYDGCAPDTICFTNCTSGGSIFTYNWNFGDGNISNATSPCHEYTSDNIFAASLIAINEFDCDDTVSYGITINPAGDASFNYSQSSFCSLDSDPTPTITGNTGGVFSCNGCVIDAGTGVIDISASASGNYIVSYTEGSGCVDVQTFNISISGSAPNPTINTVGTLCSNGSNVTLTAAEAGGTWSASCGSCINATTGEFSPSIAGPGAHTITYAFTGSCATSDNETVNVNTSADATIDPAGPFCELGVPNNLSAADAGGTWSGNGIIDSNLGTFDASAAGVGQHTITYTISGTCGDTDTEVIEVLANAVIDIYNSDTVICNDIFGFFLSAAPGGTWSGINVTDNADGTGFFSSAAIAPGSYTATYTIAGQCGDAGSINIDVFASPNADFTYTGATTINFTDASTNAVVYSWDFDDNGATSTQQNPTHTFTANGTYNVCLTVSNSFGCEHTSCQSVVINGLGLEENSSLKFSIYPNPSRGNVTIESNSLITKIYVKDLIGKNVFSNNVNALNTQISLEDVNNGFYFIEIETANGKAVKRVEITK